MSQHHVISFVIIFYVYLTRLLTLTLIQVLNWAQIILPFVEKVGEGLTGLGEIILIPVQLCSESEFQKIIIVIFSNNEDSNMFQSKRTNPLSFNLRLEASITHCVCQLVGRLVGRSVYQLFLDMLGGSIGQCHEKQRCYTTLLFYPLWNYNSAW